MELKHFLAAALALAVVCSQPVELEGDQYESRQDKPHAIRLVYEATDPMLQVNGPQQPDYTKKEIYTDTDSLSYATRSETGRAKREFSRRTGHVPQSVGYESFSMWKPPIYQLSRPYLIPIYGAPGRIPIYFPPQSLNINPGTPLDNPLPYRPFKGPLYLPPKEYFPPTTTTEKSRTMNITNRFDGDDEDDDRPVWPDAPATTQRPNRVIPTRPPRPSGMADVPPLVHDINNSGPNLLAGESEESIVSNEFAPPPRQIQSVQRPMQSAPRPVQSTPPPQNTIQVGPSNCVWAIVSCCSVSSNAVPENCFEQRGCPGPFWGSSPCDENNLRAAIKTASNYFGQ